MTQEKRKGISTRTRFEIFKRDDFTCQYCGKKTPSVILEVDHIIPVCEGGKNQKENLITSCFECNRGKAGNPLTQIMDSLEVQSDRIKERELQYKAFVKLQRTVEDRFQNEIELVNSIYKEAFPKYEMADKFKYSSVRNFISELGIVEVEISMRKAIGKCHNREQVLKYFCGICWNKIKNGVDYSPFK